jgi:hypothetical protein
MLAAAATLIALPAILSANRGSGDQGPAVAAAGIDAAPQIAGPAAQTSAETSVPTTVPVVAVAPPVPATTAPRAPTTTALAERGRATFHQYDDALWGASSCAHQSAPMGTVLVVRNLDTGQTTYCVVRDRLDPSTGFVVDVDTEVFANLGDPAAGVAPVAVSW